MSDMTELVAEVYPRDAMKRLARLAQVPIETARFWLYRSFSAARQREVARRLLPEALEKRRRLEEVICQLRDIAYGVDAAMDEFSPRQMGTHTTWRVVISDESSHTMEWAWQDAKTISLLLQLLNTAARMSE